MRGRKNLLKPKFNKIKGFTLIELLAVVVILAVVMLIAILTVLNLVSKTRLEIFRTNVISASKAAELYYTKNYIKGSKVDSLDLVSDKDKIKLSNNNFTSDIVDFYEKMSVNVHNVSDGEYCANGNRDNLEITTGDCGKAAKSCFKFSGGVITNYDEVNCSSHILIPNTINNEEVTTIGSSAFEEKCIKTVTFKSEVIIKENIFKSNNITKVTIPASIETIEDNTFANNPWEKVTIQGVSYRFNERLTDIG
ncbi:MAG: leucine-rich repeat protein [Bacilli bacterium]